MDGVVGANGVVAAAVVPSLGRFLENRGHIARCVAGASRIRLLS
jgi:tetrahydromethanopterin S-methyltransferase subunit C